MTLRKIMEPSCIYTEFKMGMDGLELEKQSHLQNDLLCYEKNSEILYSSDLIMRLGNGVGKTIDAELIPYTRSAERKN